MIEIRASMGPAYWRVCETCRGKGWIPSTAVVAIMGYEICPTCFGQGGWYVWAVA